MRCAAKSSTAAGMAIRPRNFRRGKRPPAYARSGDFGRRAHRSLLASPLTLTCRQTYSGGKAAGRCSDRRSAIFSRSIECTQSKCSATSTRLVALQRADEMPFESELARRSAAILSNAFLHIIFAECLLSGRCRSRTRRSPATSC